jgi:hypothetical protein
MEADVIGEIAETELIVAGNSIRDIRRLRRRYGAGRWRKLKGVAMVRLPDGCVMKAEVHWYEAHGIGRKEVKIKRLIVE